MELERKPYLRAIEVKQPCQLAATDFPLSLPSFQGFESLSFHPDITFLVGENGSGKSTLIEAIALLMNLNAEGGNKNTQFSSSATHSELHTCLKPIKSFAKPNDYFFLRAESFYNLATYVDDVVPDALGSYGGKSLHQQSHGESFMATLMNKLKGKGLYILDEPEAALSPNKQLEAISAIHDLVEDGSQFIIATHSPILLAYPRATIYQLSEQGIQKIAYEETEHYRVTRDFLNRHQQMIKILTE